VRVCDNGIGIERDVLDRVFDLFKRLHSRAEYEGSGLGLAITQQLAEASGAAASLEARPGAGGLDACVTFKAASRP